MSLFSLPFTVSISQSINASVAQVRPHLITFSAQQVRSPRLIQERDAKTWIEGTDGSVGASSHREGERIGAGNQTFDEINDHTSLKTTIHFLSPWKSTSTAQMYLSEEDGVTTVTRDMQGSLPLFMFWMKRMMITMISKDYKRGLTMLKDLVETGKLETSTNYLAEVDAPVLQGIGIANTAHETDLSTVMGADYSTLMTFTKNNNIEVTGGFSLYPKVDMKTGMFEFVSCMMIDPSLKDTLALPDNMQRYTTTGDTSLKVEHKGDYKYLANSRSAIYGAAMSLKKKINKKAAPYEVYVSDPRTTTNPAEFVTDIYLPLK